VERLLALHQITAMESSPAELVSFAAATGCQQVCLFTHDPVVNIPGQGKVAPFPMVTQANKGEVLAALQRYTIVVGNIEFFPVTVDVPVTDYRKGFALGAELGAKRAVTHIHDPSDERAVATLRDLADLAAEFDLTLGLEFMGLTPACNSIQRAAWFVERAARPNIGIGCDALHLMRTGGTAEDIRRIPAQLFTYAQICDGRGLHVTGDYIREALDREMPGAGDFPLQAIIEALPAATALDVEVPSIKLAAAGVPALQRCREAVDRSRALMARSHITR
jgi:sugar phosphate isomerase/epimerase